MKSFKRTKLFLKKIDDSIYSAYDRWKDRVEDFIRDVEIIQKKHKEKVLLKKISLMKKEPKLRALKKLSRNISREIENLA